MAVFTANDGRQITIVKNADDTFTVNDDAGNTITYGASVAENIYQDWDLHGVDLSSAGVPPETP